jgi:hypothetical protein
MDQLFCNPHPAVKRQNAMPVREVRREGVEECLPTNSLAGAGVAIGSGLLTRAKA